MKKLRANMDRYFDQLDDRWRALPMRKQHKYTLYFFLGYLMLTAGVIAKVWYDTGKSENDMRIEHIENPVLKKKESPASLQDSISIILKNKIYERK
ncbi:nitrogen regulatory IIA protein [Elizabethkingia meningoseptica]|uniref:nitrogen regulatory IIA protein n=1 Tax=Elizabethkingia meningoseptica TaxID=238 RepID=UPI0023B002D0|nr:nitrogen regulatory IIA protein [Elizabethkingia meningoseptica]MDE5437600.1 nitrogen regulatory IIA protein [Elizabethkingia meningoseptica]MDE5467994.1 nitrogen regulatory IIA protein [Elizabethkingia meningoseptica]MDE5474913.1 nitrogen regulatory IIA protein [Elizabethkingia meningoseptica]MDE5478346.1 nitrogen regulatory IIA protein [Elizabethkingia meningoseptica]MDE5486745.1 nitrogen regulatory IIA protein [Elizabethkingia meningoseptica]